MDWRQPANKQFETSDFKNVEIISEAKFYWILI